MDDFITEKYFSIPNIVNYYKSAVNNVGLWNSEKKLIEKYIDKKSKILDIGCGAGRLSIGLYNLGYKNICGIDLSSEMIEQAKSIALNNQYKIKYDCCNANNIIYNDNYFEAGIFSFNGLVTIPNKNNRYKVVYEINRILKDNGIFIFTTDDRRMKKQYSWIWRDELNKWRNGTQDSRLIDFGDFIFKTDDGEFYFSFPTKEDIVEMLNKCGFNLLQDISMERFKESETVHKFCSECRFWVAQKKVDCFNSDIN